MIAQSKLIIIFLFLLTLPLTLLAQQGEVIISQDNAINKLLDYKKDVKTLKVYKIQVYQSVDPNAAKRAKSTFLNTFNEWQTDIEWQTPNYKVWVGNFTTRLEADRALVKIKRKYMNAIIFQPKQEKE